MWNEIHIDAVRTLVVGRGARLCHLSLHVCNACTQRDKRRCLVSLDLELYEVVSCLMWAQMKLGPLEEQRVLLATETSIQLLFFLL